MQKNCLSVKTVIIIIVVVVEVSSSRRIHSIVFDFLVVVLFIAALAVVGVVIHMFSYTYIVEGNIDLFSSLYFRRLSMTAERIVSWTKLLKTSSTQHHRAQIKSLQLQTSQHHLKQSEDLITSPSQVADIPY